MKENTSNRTKEVFIDSPLSTLTFLFTDRSFCQKKERKETDLVFFRPMKIFSSKDIDPRG